MDITNLKRKIAEGKTDTVIEHLINLLHNKDNIIFNQVIILANQYNQWKTNQILNIENENFVINRINNALLTIIDTNANLLSNNVVKNAKIHITLINNLNGEIFNLNINNELLIKDFIDETLRTPNFKLQRLDKENNPIDYKIYCKDLGIQLEPTKKISDYQLDDKALVLLPYILKDYIKLNKGIFSDIHCETEFLKYYDFQIFQQFLNYIYKNYLIKSVPMFCYGKAWLLKDITHKTYLSDNLDNRQKKLFEMEIKPQTELLIEKV